MSHVEKIKLNIVDLDAVAMVAEQFGMVLTEAKTYNWYGYSVGDYPVPEGFTAKDLGKCDYKLSFKDMQAGDYEAGLVRRGDHYELVYDFFGPSGARLLDTFGGKTGDRFKQEYGAAVAMKHYAELGYETWRTVNEQGEVIVQATR